jgi:hypothetical protein
MVLSIILIPNDEITRSVAIVWSDGSGNYLLCQGLTLPQTLIESAKMQQATPPAEAPPHEPQAAFDLMGRAMTKIRKIDTSAWTEEDNTAFRDSLASLKAEIDHYLNPPSNPEQGE